MLIRPVTRPVVRSVCRNITASTKRWALNFDGVGIRGVLANRAINPDGDIDIEFHTPANIGNTGFDRVILSQCLSGTFSSREFDLLISGSGALAVNIGGTVSTLAFPGTFSAQEKLKIIISGGTATTYRANGEVIRAFSITRGAAREPSAQTTIGARFNGTTYSNFSQGIQRDVKINGTRWPIADRNQVIQVPEPSGLGAELITPALLVTPAIAGSQWTYLGNGRWEYVGDGSANELRFLTSIQHPAQGYLEFEIESISGTITCTNAGIDRAKFNSTGVKRFFYTDFNEVMSAGSAIIFKRTPAGAVASCIIKNISFKPLGTCNPITLANVTSANWEDLEI